MQDNEGAATRGGKPLIEVTVGSLDASGDGLAVAADGTRHVVPGALPGETALVRTRRRIRGKYWSQVVEILDASPMRVDAPCAAYAMGCGGCQLQHLALRRQRDFKLDLITSRLASTCEVDLPERIDVVALDPWHFRTNLRVGVDSGGAAGFRKRRTNHVISGTGCEVAHPLLEELLEVGRFEGADEVTLRCGDRTGERLASPSPDVDRVIVPDDVRDDYIHELAAGRRWRISAQSFFQSRPDAVDAMAGIVADGARDLDGPQVAVDLYSGVGIFAGALVDLGWSVTAVESSRSSVEDARVNLASEPVTIIESDVARWRPTPATLVVADPNRIGIGGAGCSAVVGTGAQRVVLISCDVSGLANDSRALARAGYRLTGMTMIDVFPHTFHIEVISIFDKRN